MSVKPPNVLANLRQNGHVSLPIYTVAKFSLDNNLSASEERTFLNDFIKQLDMGINFFEILPYIIIWAIFGITYGVCINRKLLIKDIFLSSFLASIVWNISKLLFVSYAFYNKNYTSIYGSMSILLFFFLWLYVSWIVFLFGLKFLIKLSEVHDEQGV